MTIELNSFNSIKQIPIILAIEKKFHAIIIILSNE